MTKEELAKTISDAIVAYEKESDGLQVEEIKINRSQYLLDFNESVLVSIHIGQCIRVSHEY